ncbi:unnamed protein product [Aphanomyces euteiches]
MSRELLSEATSIHEGPVPAYLLDQIGRHLGGNDSASEKMADFLLSRMGKSNVNVKLKAMQIINHCLKAGDNAFNNTIRQDEGDIRALSNYQGNIDPAFGDEKNRRVRMAALEMLNYLGLQSNFGAPPPPSSSSSTFMPQAYPSNQGPPSHSTNTWGNTSARVPSTTWGSQPPQQQQAPQAAPSQYGSSNSNPSGPWGRENSAPSYGNNSNNGPPQYGNPQPPYRDSQQYGNPPPPYRDSPQYGNGNSTYGGSSAPSYGSNSGPGSTYGGSSAPAFGGNSAPAYGGNSAPAYGGNSAPAYGGNSGPSYGGNSAPSYGGPQQSFNPPQYGGNQPPDYSHSSAPSSFNTQDSWRGGSSSSSGAFVPAKPSTTAGVWSSSGYEKKEVNVHETVPTRWSSSRDNRPTVLVGSKGPLFGKQTFQPGSSGGFNPPVGPPGLMPMSSTGNFGTRPSSSAPVVDRPNSGIEQTLDEVKRKAFMLKDKWDRRNMDKSMASSLADHDDYVSTSAALDSRGQSYQPQAPTGSSDKSGEYERSLIDDLCPPGGLARAPPAENLKRFVDLAKTLNENILGDLLLDKLEDESWLVRLKGLCVWEALLEAPGCAHYGEWLEENLDLLQHCGQDPKSAVATKAKRILQLLGIEPSHQPVAAPPAHQHKPASGSGGAHAAASSPAVDLLAMGDLNLGGPPAPQQSQAPPLAVPGAMPPQQPMSQPDPLHFAPAPAPASKDANLLDLSFSPVKNAAPAPIAQLDPLNLSASHAAHLPPETSRHLGDFGKDLFTLANSPRHSTEPQQPQQQQQQQQQQPPQQPEEKSAFSFM